MPIIEIKNLTKHFGVTPAVEDLTCSIEPGELFGLVGPDGAGKTTIIRTLCGIVPPTSGTASVLGFDIIKQRSEIVKRVGYLSQRFSLYGDLTVDENIAFFARIHGVTDFVKRRDELLAFTRMQDARDRLAERLSGGMKQKLALACTLIHAPKIIFLDEPTTGVDPVSRRDFWKILSTLLEQGITIMMSTPYLDEAERCSRVALMNEGRLLELGTPRSIRDKLPGKVFEIICHPVRDAYKLISSTNQAHEVQMYGDRLNVILDSGNPPIEKLVESLKQKQIHVDSWRTVPPRLENVFISMMRTAHERH